MPTCFLGLGSNRGDRLAHLRAAVRALATSDIAVEAASPVYVTSPVGFVRQPPFLNGVVRAQTTLTPEALLVVVRVIEASRLRERSVRWGPRTLDIDLLLYDSLVMRDMDLTIPHRELARRAFVLAPLCDLAPELWLPPSGPTVQEALKALNAEPGFAQGVWRTSWTLV